MKKRELNDLKSKSTDEIRKRITDLKKDIAKLTVEKTSGKNKKQSLTGMKKRDLARLLTVIRMKEL